MRKSYFFCKKTNHTKSAQVATRSSSNRGRRDALVNSFVAYVHQSQSPIEAFSTRAQKTDGFQRDGATHVVVPACVNGVLCAGDNKTKKNKAEEKNNSDL